MTLIKSEPNTDGPVSLSGGNNTGISKSKETTDSRPALGSKKVNVASKQGPVKDLTKHKLEEFLLSAGSGKQLSPNSPGGFKTSFSGDKTLIKKEPESSRNLSQNSYSTPVKRTIANEGSIDKEKKLNTAEKLKKVVKGGEEQGPESAARPLRTPGPYIPITKMLYESNNRSSSNSEAPLFQDLDQEHERKFCQEASQWSLDEWIDQGQMLLNAHTSLVGQLVRERIELSGKFRAITSVINNRAEALNKQGQLLDEKLRKIETLGKEILDII